MASGSEVLVCPMIGLMIIHDVYVYAIAAASTSDLCGLREGMIKIMRTCKQASFVFLRRKTTASVK